MKQILPVVSIKPPYISALRMSLLDLKTYLNIFELCLIFHKKNKLSTSRNLEIHISPKVLNFILIGILFF